jgi:CheY-like chemotaxis protein
MATGGAPIPVLIVEDDPDVRNALVDFLGAAGYAVTTARNGREAIQYLQGGGAPRVILLDLMMPVMSGAEFRIAQRADAALAGIPVVVMSAAIDVDASALSVAALLRKPMDTDVLLETIARLVGP